MKGIYRFINTNVPTNGCNLRCEYCYIRQHGEENVLHIEKRTGLFRYSVNHMLKALTIERLGGPCMFNISGSGETLLCPDIFLIAKGLLEAGHYVAIISNCTVTAEIDKFINLDQECRNRLFFKSSLHYQELKRRGILDLYAKNMKKIKENNISFSIEIVSNDYILEEIEELKAWALESFGALPHVLAGRSERRAGEYPKFETKLNEEEFYKVWSSFDSDLFVYQYTDYILPHNDEFCYAGVYTGSLDLGTGNFFACPGNKTITNFFEDIDQPIQFAPMAKACPFPYCFCGFFLQVLAGACNESYCPDVLFYQFRDRVCDDGSHWLTPSIKEIFSHRCSEYHVPFNESKKFWINAIMQKRYRGKDPTEYEIQELSYIVSKMLTDLKVNTVAIYGFGGLGKLLFNILRLTEVKVVGAMDLKYKNMREIIPIYSPNNVPDGIDTIIVSVFYQYTEIAPRLTEQTKVRVISILDLVN